MFQVWCTVRGTSSAHFTRRRIYGWATGRSTNYRSITVHANRLGPTVPTIHVHGLLDPGIDLQRQLGEFCEKCSMTEVEWAGEHRMPLKMVDVSAVVKEIRRVAYETGCY